MVNEEKARIRSIGPGNRAFAFQRRNLYPFLSKEEMGSWMNDEGDLRTRWFEARNRLGKRIGIVAWEIYDIHQYEKNGPRYLILDCYTIEIEDGFRRQGFGTQLFRRSLESTIEELEVIHNFIVGAIQIETHTAAGFYRKIFAALPMKLQEENRSIAGHEITVFWAPLR